MTSSSAFAGQVLLQFMPPDNVLQLLLDPDEA